ncbi:MAG: CPBP family intramembrane metalloprotease [Parvularculaceae bacterium]|nr:CPBP family intramembrane metalloprotease [Parvularculaceae bacterium]
MRAFFEIIAASAVLIGMMIWRPIEPGGSVAIITTAIFVTFLLMSRKESWRDLGLKWPNSWGGFFAGAGATIAVLISIYAAAYAAQTFNAVVLGNAERNLPEVATVAQLVTFLVISWTSAAIGEELVFRGFLMTRIADLFGRSGLGWAVALVVSSALFGIGHFYQGLPGIIFTGTVALAFGAWYIIGRRNLLPLIIAHGIVDTLSMVALFMMANGMIEAPA